MKQREVTFDVVRSLCIIWIVFFWHIDQYIDLNSVPNMWGKYSEYFTTIVLGTFTFCSGYFLKRKIIGSVNDIYDFYISRIKRFWFLYFISSTILFFATSLVGIHWFSSFSRFCYSLIGLSMFSCFGPPPHTLWYMVMLIVFYILTPIILYWKQLIVRVTISLTLIIAFYTLDYYNLIDVRFIYYFPIYIIGLLLPDYFVKMLKKNVLLTIGCGFVFTIFITYYYEGNYFYQTLICITGLPVIWGVSEILSKVPLIIVWATYISYASMNMYLFHRHIYLTFRNLWFFCFDSKYLPLWFICLVVWPIIVFASNKIQRMYDYMLQKMN